MTRHSLEVPRALPNSHPFAAQAASPARNPLRDPLRDPVRSYARLSARICALMRAAPVVALMGLPFAAPVFAGGGHAPAAASNNAHAGEHGGAQGAGALCQGYGPQTPRDISIHEGRNARLFTLAPPAADMNLCNIHMHTNAEHRGPGFSISAGEGPHGGYMCNNSQSLSRAELKPVIRGKGGQKGMAGVKPGDTVEVHWVFSSCAVTPGQGLGSCVSESCANPELRVESQVFLVVNDADALDFEYFTYEGTRRNGLHQPKELPGGTGAPVLFAGSTTGPKYTQSQCSPYQVTWSVRPNCAKVDIHSIHEWANRGNVFGEDHSHGVRQLVTAPELLSPIGAGARHSAAGH